MLRIWTRDPRSVAFLTPESGIRIRDLGEGKKSGSGINIPDNFFDILETVFRVKILIFFDADPDPGSEIFLTLGPGSVMEKFASATPEKMLGFEELDVPLESRRLLELEIPYLEVF
jgi:hypothetical protein